MHEDKKWEYVEKEAIERENNMIKVGQSSTVSGHVLFMMLHSRNLMVAIYSFIFYINSITTHEQNDEND